MRARTTSLYFVESIDNNPYIRKIEIGYSVDLIHEAVRGAVCKITGWGNTVLKKIERKSCGEKRWWRTT